MTIGIIATTTQPSGSCDSAAALISALPQQGVDVFFLDQAMGQEDPNPGQQRLNAQKWKQLVYRHRNKLSLLHCFSQSWSDIYWCASTAKGMRLPTVATLIDERLFTDAALPIHRQSVRRSLELIDQFIVPHTGFADALERLGCSKTRIRLLDSIETLQPVAELPQAFESLVPGERYTLLTSGPIGFHRNSDRSGFDTLIEALAILMRRGTLVSSLLRIENTTALGSREEEHLAALQTRIKQAKLEQAIRWCPATLELRTLATMSAFYVEASNSYDGNANARLTGLPTIACDTAPPPEAQFSYRDRDPIDLARTIEACIHGPRDQSAPSRFTILDLYTELRAS